MANKLPIGVFDSGVGGLTVLESLMKQFPNEDFIYVADQGHCPYGTKTEDEIRTCVLNVAKYLERQNVKAIVIACNTASLFVEDARKAVNVPVISVIEPTCMRAIETTKTKKIAVLATNATIKKGKYQALLTDAGVEGIGVPCSEFVDFVENKDLNDPIGQKIVNEKLAGLVGSGIDTLIHGCTHFSIIEDKMRNVLGDINYIACGDPTANLLFNILEKSENLNETKHERVVSIGTTGDVEHAKQTMTWFKMPHSELSFIDLDK